MDDVKKPKVNIDEIARDIHQNARNKGFWDEERNRGEMLMLIVSELAEALEEHREGKPLIYRSYIGKPEGLVIELADAVIRCLDTLYSEWHVSQSTFLRTHYKEEMKQQLKIGRGGRDQYVVGDNVGENLLRATSFVLRSQMNIMWLIPACVYMDRMCMALGSDLWEAIELKMDFNKTRSYKHGKAY